MNMDRRPTRKTLLLVILAALATGLLVSTTLWVASRRAAEQASQPTSLPRAHTNDTAQHAGPDKDTPPSPTVLATNPALTPSTKLAAPFGPTLNTRTIALSNGNTMMDSTCAAESGATCKIVASKDGQDVTVSETKPVTPNGVQLVWDAKKLTAGVWQVRAVASKAGQTSSSGAETLTVVP